MLEFVVWKVEIVWKKLLVFIHGTISDVRQGNVFP